MSAYETIGTGVQNAGEAAWGTGATEITVPVIVGNLISILLGLLGLVFLVLTVYAGFLYLTAQGEDAQVKKAKAILTKGAIGIALVIGSYAITNVVVDAITTVSSGSAATNAAAE